MRAVRAPRADNRLPQILDAAARLFRTQGFQGTSVRDIVRAVDMLPGSLYYHFATKEDLLAEVYAEGVRRISARVRAAIEPLADPWARLEAACIAHLEAILEDDDYAQVVTRVRPGDAPAAQPRLIEQRDAYEALLARVVQDLPLPRGTDRRTLRLMLLGALNWSQTWYQPGRDAPKTIARRFVALLQQPLNPKES